MKKLRGDHLMLSWHDTQNQPEIGFDGNNVIIKISLDKPVHYNWNCIESRSPITCPQDIQNKCMSGSSLAPCIVGYINLEDVKND